MGIIFIIVGDTEESCCLRCHRCCFTPVFFLSSRIHDRQTFNVFITYIKVLVYTHVYIYIHIHICRQTDRERVPKKQARIFRKEGMHLKRALREPE